MHYDEIITQALFALGQQGVEGANATHPRADVRIIVRNIEIARDFVIQDHDWLECQMSFALNAVSLTNFRSGYAYGLPAGVLRMSKIETMGEWAVLNHLDENGNIMRVLWSAYPISLAYGLFRLEWSVMSNQLARLCWLQAAKMSMVAITGSQKLLENLNNDYVLAMQDALSLEAHNQGLHEPLHWGLHEDRYTAI